MICDKLKKLLPDTIRLLLYIDYLDIDEFYEVCERTALPVEQIIESKCGNISGSIGYLLNFTNTKEEPEQFSSNKAYSFELYGVNEELTNTGHAFILINDGNEWLMLDSYIGYRRFRCERVELNHVLSIVKMLRTKFRNDLWTELTGVDENDDETDKIDVMVFEYDYSMKTINKKFKELIKRAEDRLNNSDIGLSDEYLSIIAEDLDSETANNYLDSLYKLVE